MTTRSGLPISTQQELETWLEGDTDVKYLTEHFPRFLQTQRLAAQRWHWEGARVLDVGAHWLHQAVMFAAQGSRVTALDRADTLNCPGVQLTAKRHGIELMEIDDLAIPEELARVEENSIDVVLFCEIIEHLTFNPLPMWRALYRVLRPGGRIVITTPNCYGSANLLRGMGRLLKGDGAGISVEHILQMPTSRPHWKEYSLKELKRYFSLLSPDFSIGHAAHINFTNGASLRWQRKALDGLEQLIPGLRNGLYVEIDLPQKTAGVLSAAG